MFVASSLMLFTHTPCFLAFCAARLCIEVVSEAALSETVLVIGLTLVSQLVSSAYLSARARPDVDPAQISHFAATREKSLSA
jgi:hypothetical protein